MTSNLLTTYLELHDELVLRERIRTNLVDWATDVMTASGLTPSAHHRFLLDSLDLVVQGTVKRLMVLMPPGSAKSTYTYDLYPVQARTRKSVGSMTRKLSVTSSHHVDQLAGTRSRKKVSVSMLKSLNEA